MSDQIRYGYYLRPSPELCAAQAQVHDLLRRQYGLEVAGKFMPHATVKGFFKSSAPEGQIAAAAAGITMGMTSFRVWNHGILDWRSAAIVLGIMDLPSGERNPALLELHERALGALLPLVDSDCNFTFTEWVRERYTAHLTLAMDDIPTAFFDEILDFCRRLEPIGPSSFMAERLQLFAFESDDWNGAWGKTLRWRLLESWALDQAPQYEALGRTKS